VTEGASLVSRPGTSFTPVRIHPLHIAMDVKLALSGPDALANTRSVNDEKGIHFAGDSAWVELAGMVSALRHQRALWLQVAQSRGFRAKEPASTISSPMRLEPNAGRNLELAR
jgi:hypothetical protein